MTVTLARDTDATAGDPLADRRAVLRRRLLGAPRTVEAKLWAFLGPAIVTVIGGILRFWDVGRPHQLVFDETYYVKEGWSMFLYGFVERCLIPFGLHHIWNVPFFFQVGDFTTPAGQVVHGEATRFFAGDPTAGNLGGAYRDDDVDIKPSGEGGYVVGWFAAEEWLAYTVNVDRDGPYAFQARVVGLLESVGAAMPGIGYLLGGVLTAIWSPRVAYLIAGIGVVAIAAAMTRRLASVPS